MMPHRFPHILFLFFVLLFQEDEIVWMSSELVAVDAFVANRFHLLTQIIFINQGDLILILIALGNYRRFKLRNLVRQTLILVILIPL